MEEFKTKDGGQVVQAGEGRFIVGANPFGFACAVCGTYHNIEFDFSGEEMILNVMGSEEETQRFCAHMAENGGTTIQHLLDIMQDDRQLLANWAATGKFIIGGLMSALDSIQKATVALRLKSPDAALLNCLMAEETLLKMVPPEERKSGLVIV